MMDFQTLALLVNIGIVLAVLAGAFRRRGTAGAVVLIALCAIVALWTAAYVAHGAAEVPGLGTAVAIAAYVASFLTASCSLWIVLIRTNKRRWISARNVVLFALLPISTLVLLGAVLSREGAAD